MLIIGCGSPERGDDAAGVHVAERLRTLGLNTRVCSGEASELMEAWDRVADVLVIDCVVTGAAAGTVHLWDAYSWLPIKRTGDSTHAFGLGEAVELTRALRRLPARLRIYGIEGQKFEIGSETSAEVLRGVEEVVSRIVAEVTAGP